MRRPRRLVLAVLAGLAATQALAADTPRDDLTVSLRTLVILIFAAMLGGMASWISKVRNAVPGSAALSYLIGELCISSFAGFCCYLLCDYLKVPLNLTMLSVGVAGHMGTKAITAFERYVARRFMSSTGDNKA